MGLRVFVEEIFTGIAGMSEVGSKKKLASW